MSETKLQCVNKRTDIFWLNEVVDSAASAADVDENNDTMTVMMLQASAGHVRRCDNQPELLRYRWGWIYVMWLRTWPCFTWIRWRITFDLGYTGVS